MTGRRLSALGEEVWDDPGIQVGKKGNSGEAARKGALEWFRTERGTQILAGIWILIVFASHDWTVTGGGYGTDQAGLAGAVFLVNTALAFW